MVYILVSECIITDIIFHCFFLKLTTAGSLNRFKSHQDSNQTEVALVEETTDSQQTETLNNLYLFYSR